MSSAGRLVGLGGGAGEEGAATPPPRKAPRRPRAPKPGMDDTTLTRKVETEIFRVRGVAKGKIDVNAADGVVWLRGEAKTPAQIRQLEAKAAAIPEVERVEVLLHLPKTPAPTRTDTPARQRRTRRSAPRSAARTKAARSGNEDAARREGAGPAGRRAGAARERTTAERRTAPGEPAPASLAATGRGRQPAPLGSPVPAETQGRAADTATGVADRAPEPPGGAATDARPADTATGPEGRAPARPESATGPEDHTPTRPETGADPEDRAPTGEPAADREDRAPTRRFTAEEHSGEGEPLPSDLAERGEGRQPAPLGSTDDAPGGGGGGAGTAIP